jgi:MoaA/NifB/PqqE/SkfB family radical SAM enzyme
MFETIMGGRFIINFDDTCNMRCPYCYVPFTKRPVNFRRLADVLVRCSELGFKVVTFGGGDPLLYPDFRKALRIAAGLGFVIHVDTNAIGLCDADLDVFDCAVSLVGLPLDGPNRLVHGLMRGAEHHFDRVIAAIGMLRGRKPKVKINTVVGRYNLATLGNIKHILDKTSISIWSLYQFMPLHDAACTRSCYDITKADFLSSAGDLSDSPYTIEVCPGDTRRDSYIFVTPHGDVYTHCVNDETKYDRLGVVFQEDWIERYQFVKTLRDEARHRYA